MREETYDLSLTSLPARYALHTEGVCIYIHRYWWEVVIAVRKLLFVTFVMFSPGESLAFTLINLFVIIIAFGAHCWVRPFANVDGEREHPNSFRAGLI